MPDMPDVPHLPAAYAWVDAHCLSLKGCVRDYKAEWDATRYMLNGKFFAMVGTFPDNRPFITLKLEPGYGLPLREQHAEVLPGYYMNKMHWNSVCLDGDFAAALLRELIDESYGLILASLPKKTQKALLED